MNRALHTSVINIQDTAARTPDNDRVRRAQMHPVLGRVVVERQQHAGVVGDLRGGLGKLGPVGCVEGLHCGEGVVPFLGAPELRQGLLRPRVCGLLQRGQDIRGLVEGPSPSSTSLIKGVVA